MLLQTPCLRLGLHSLLSLLFLLFRLLVFPGKCLELVMGLHLVYVAHEPYSADLYGPSFLRLFLYLYHHLIFFVALIYPYIPDLLYANI